ncbi:Metastasis suppressor protein 1 [Sparganum proliferum]
MPRRARAKRRKLAASPPSLGAKIVTEDIAGASSSLVQWEDFIGKSSKLNASLTTTIQCLAGFLEAFQKISDIAQGSNFGLRDLGMAMTRFCLRQRGVESRLRTFNSQLGDCLIAPLTDRLEEWKRTVNQLDRDTVKELRKARGELQRATAEAEKCKKRLRRKDSTTTMLAFAHEEPSSVDVSCYSASGTSSSVQANFVQQDLLCKQRALESLERNCLKRAVVEERRRFTELTTCLEPVLAKVMSDDACGVSLGSVEGAYSIRLGPFLVDDTSTSRRLFVVPCGGHQDYSPRASSPTTLPENWHAHRTIL